LFELGLADENEVDKIAAIEKRYVEAIAKKDFVSAFYIFDEMMGGDFQPFGSLYSNITSLPDYFNYMTPTYPILPFPIYLNLPSTRRALHVGDVDFWVLNSTVEHYMIPDFMDSITPFLIPIMDNYKVLIYSGQLDVILGPAGTERFLFQLHWNGLHEYRSARKQHWYLNNDDKTNYVTGYVRQARRFTQVVLRRAGHMTILDAPAECLDMLNRFIKDESWSMPTSSSKRTNRVKVK
jgi:vitellogenic carboxypeptidase-like protein